MGKIKSRYIFISMLFLVLVLAYVTSAKTAPPGIEDVLRKPGFTFDWKGVFVGFFALSLSTLSFAKAYEIFKTSKAKKKDALPENPIEESMKTELDRIACELKYKNKESEELMSQIHRLQEEIKRKIEKEDTLKKSIISLRKEYDKTLIEKENLTLELNRQNLEDLFPKEEKKVEIKPEFETKPEAKIKVRRATKAKVAKKRRKK